MPLPFPPPCRYRAAASRASSCPGCRKPPRIQERHGEQGTAMGFIPEWAGEQAGEQAGACRQGLLREHAGLLLVSRWQSPPAALQNSLVALWGPRGLAGDHPWQLEHPAALRLREGNRLRVAGRAPMRYFLASVASAAALHGAGAGAGLACSFWSICRAPPQRGWQEGLAVLSISIKRLYQF